MRPSDRPQIPIEFRWNISPLFPQATQDVLREAGLAILSWLDIPANSGLRPNHKLRILFKNIAWQPSNFFWRKAGFHHVEFSTIHIDPELINLETAVHEMAHILDNTLGNHGLASIFGGGPADQMISHLGLNPDEFLPRFLGRNYESKLRARQIELNPTTYGRTRGPAEDFAESFRMAVLHPVLLKTSAPKRYEWFEIWRRHLVIPD